MKKIVNGIEVDVSQQDELERMELDEKWVAYVETELYKEKRRELYPSIQDQLDMIYKDKINGTTKWVDLITSIKEEYPRPTPTEAPAESKS